MAEPQPRRYLTRARAKATASSTSKTNPAAGAGVLKPPRRLGAAKRKALTEAVSSNEASASEDNGRPGPRATRGRPAKKQSLSPPPEATSSTLNAAPKRRTTRSTAAAKRSVAKKVTFASPAVAVDDKENHAPAETQSEEKSDDTDTLMSASIGALSVKARRIPKSKLKQPSGSLDPLMPALSPTKARRPIKPAQPTNDDELEDELSAVNSPRLSVKPKRPIKPVVFDEDALSQKPSTENTSTLFGSPAKRPAVSPLKKDLRPAHESLLSVGSPAKKSALSSPAKRPLGNGKLTDSYMKVKPRGFIGSSLKFPIINEQDKEEDGPAQSKKVPEDDLSEDELSSPAKPVGRQLFLTDMPVFHKPAMAEEKARSDDDIFFDTPSMQPHGGANIQEEVDMEDVDKKIARLNRPIAGVTPPSPYTVPAMALTQEALLEKSSHLEEVLEEHVMDAQENDHDAEKENFRQDDDGDILMDAVKNNPIPVSPTRKHRPASAGGSSYGLFLDEDDDEPDDADIFDDDSENVPPPPPPASGNLATSEDQFSGVELDRSPRRNFGQELSFVYEEAALADAFLSLDMPIDPMLLSTNDDDEIVVGYSEDVRQSLVPLKFLDEDENENENDENIFPPQASPRSPPNTKHIPEEVKQSPPKPIQPTRKRRSSGVGPVTGVLAGAVVYVDVYCADGADASTSFENVLRTLGARVLKQWSWNPAVPGAKVGITHVVYKDGSPTTLRKVRESRGLVTCVSLAWVVACAEQQGWAEENDYLVDLEIVHGGHRRRKSMEPKAYAALLDQLVGPAPRNNQEQKEQQPQPPKTPSKVMPSQLLMYTAPPKGPEEQMEAALRERLLLARRKSMRFAPKIGSPLSKYWTADD